MGRKRSAKFSKLNPEEWAKYTAVKFGTATYKVDRAAPPEDKELYGCGVIPFGITPPSTNPHNTTSISRAGAKFLAAMGGTTDNEFGIERNTENTTAPPAGWYPALCFITLRAPDAVSTNATSQLTGRTYKKYRTRSASIPFGRRTIATEDARTGTATTGVADVDYADSKKAISTYIGTGPGTFGETYEVASLSFENEIWQPEASTLPSLSSLTAVGTITAF